MIKSVVLILTWLTIVSSIDTINVSNDVPVSSDITSKVKRYYNHDVPSHKSPCPPFYPHLHESKSPMHLTRPYGPPAYPKSVYESPATMHHHPQIIHQPIYPSYHPKQSIPYVKPHIPIAKPDYHYLPIKSHQITHQAQPIHHVIQQQAQWQYHSPQQIHQKPHFAYAPLYHKPMMHHQQPISYIKPMNYHAHQMQGIVYKMEPIKCAPCHQHEMKYIQPVKHHYSMPKIIHAEPIQPVHHSQPLHHPSPIYLPTSHAHIQSTASNLIGHHKPCID